MKSPGAAPAAWPPPEYACDSGITCDVTAEEPTLLYNRTNNDYIDFFAETRCSEELPQISMGQDVIHSTPIDPNNPLTSSSVKNDTKFASTSNSAACQPGQYAVNAAARITPPDGYVVQGSLHDTSATVTFSASDCGGGGDGGGGGCATATPSTSASPPCAART